MCWRTKEMDVCTFDCLEMLRAMWASQSHLESRVAEIEATLSRLKVADSIDQHVSCVNSVEVFRRNCPTRNTVVVCPPTLAL
uniref:Uncharacterized protein n=1 Tax=Trichobilharzia regenti TaxID=157069 RepID=A0AA85JC96_TRIRE|nr:unnamed protein product [Trichobilharzia regenti]